MPIGTEPGEGMSGSPWSATTPAKCSIRGLRDKLAGQRVQIYTNVRRNEDEIDLLEPGITILNVLSIKGQEFDAVFLMEFADLLLGDTAENKRKMYMLCARARDNLFLMYDGDRLPDVLFDRLPGPDVLDPAMSGQEEFVFDIAPARGPVDDNRPLPKWLGLVTNHRAAASTPARTGGCARSRASCFVLGRESFVSEAVPGGRNTIPVRLSFDVDKLPFPDALIDLKRGTTGGNPRAVRWRRTDSLVCGQDDGNPLRRAKEPSDGDGGSTRQRLPAGYATRREGLQR